MPTLEIKGLSKTFGNIKALEDVTLRVEDKEYVCILGPSGCGKSTLIKCVAGIIQPDRGEVLVDGRSIANLNIEERNIGYVFQEIALFPHLTVRDNVSYGLAVKGLNPERVATITNEMLDLTRMRERARSIPRELSGGAQQKVAVGRAIATGSHLFLLDEPLGALDALVRAELRYELRRLASDLGLTVMHVTHDQEEALSISDRIVVMKRGRIVEIGKPAEIYLSPKTIFAENFVGETNLVEGTIMEADRESCTVVVGGQRIRMPNYGRKVGQRVVVSVRPEFIALRPPSRSQGAWKGKVKHENFLGALNRYVVEVEGGIELVVHMPNARELREFRAGDEVAVRLGDVGHMLLFDYPPEGLEKEIALE